MASVFGWLNDEAGCGFYRVMQPYQHLESHGFEVAWGRSITRTQMETVDLVVAQRLLDDDALMAIRWRKETLGLPYVYEIDDLLTEVDRASYVRRIFDNNPRMLEIYRECAAAADAVTVSTEPLAEHLRELNDNVYVLPNSVPDYMVEIERPDPGDKVVVGWAGSATHHGDMGEIEYALKRMHRWYSDDVELVVMGFDYSKTLGVKATFLPWENDIPTFHRNLARLDIGLCPLARTAFNRSKSGLKAQEYQALGIVPIATDIAPYQEVIRDGIDGFLVRTPNEWKDRIELLVNDEELRLKMSNEGRKVSEERLYSKTSAAWADAYTEILNAHRSHTDNP